MALNAWQRYQAEDRLISLIATAITLHHPQADRMVGIGLGHLEHVADEKLLESTERLTAWIADAEAAQQSGALPAPAEVG